MLRLAPVAVLVLALTLSGTAAAFVLLREKATRDEEVALKQRSAQSTALFDTFARQVETVMLGGGTIAEATNGNPQAFRRAMDQRLAASFLSSDLLLRLDRTPQQLAKVGRREPILFPVLGSEGIDKLHRISATGELSLVAAQSIEGARVLGFASSPSPGSSYVVYGELFLPDVLEASTASDGLLYAFYLDGESDESLIGSNTDDLPITGRRVTGRVRLGSEQPLLVFAAEGSLTGGLAGTLRWLVLGGSLVWSLILTALVEASRRGRDQALGLAADLAGKNAELDESQEQLLQAQKMEAVGRLAGGVAHDFNNLLTIVTTSSSFLLSDLSKDDPLREEAEEISSAAARAARLTQQLLAFSRKQVLQPEILDVNEMVTDVERMLRRLIGEDVELSTVLADGLGQVEADPGQLDQILLNLAVNARDAMPSGGRLTIETRNADPSEIAERLDVTGIEGAFVLIAVRDTGVGMDDRTLSRIFEPFFTTKEKERGTGLGLSTVFGIVSQSGGHIAVESEPGEGTCFHIYLPRVEAESAADDATTTIDLDRESTKPGTILHHRG